MIDFIPVLQITPDWKWRLYVFPALVFLPYREVVVRGDGVLVESKWFWLCFGIGKRTIKEN